MLVLVLVVLQMADLSSEVGEAAQGSLPSILH